MRNAACAPGISWFNSSVQNSGISEAGYRLLTAAVYLYGVRNQREAGGPAKRKTLALNKCFCGILRGRCLLNIPFLLPLPCILSATFGNRQADASVHPSHGHCRSHIQHMPIIPFLLFLYFDISICLFFSACNALPVQKHIACLFNSSCIDFITLL